MSQFSQAAPRMQILLQKSAKLIFASTHTWDLGLKRLVFHGNVGIRQALSAGCAMPESEVIVEVSLAHPFNADSAGLKKGT